MNNEYKFDIDFGTSPYTEQEETTSTAEGYDITARLIADPVSTPRDEEHEHQFTQEQIEAWDRGGWIFVDVEIELNTQDGDTYEGFRGALTLGLTDTEASAISAAAHEVIGEVLEDMAAE